MVQPINQVNPPSYEIAFSNETILLTSIVGFTILFASLACLCHFSPSQQKYDQGRGGDGNNHGEEDGDDDGYNQLLQDADVSKLNRAQRKARAKLLMKKKRRNDNNNANNNQVANVDDDHGHDHEQNDNDNELIPPMADTHVNQLKSRKERQKAAKEEERHYRREYEEARRTLHVQNEIKKMEIKEKVMQEKKQLMDYERIIAQEEQIREWTYMFRTTDITVNDFVKELKMNQIINLDEAANKYQVSVQDLIKRLEQLEKEGRIDHGILDRNQYYYVSHDDMIEISNYIKEKEAVTLHDITLKVTQIIAEKGDSHVAC